MASSKQMSEGQPMGSATIALDRASPLPLYEQVKRRLLSMVLSWPQSSDRFHTDQELSDFFGVSRMTVRQAVQELVDGGYLRRARGSGTFVCGPKVNERFSLSTGFIDQWADSGQMLELKVLHCMKEPCLAHVSQQLGINERDLVWNIVRHRKVKHVPISIDYRFIPVSVISVIDPEQVAAGSLLDLMNRHVDLAYGDLTVEAAAAQVEHADYLGLMPGDPILRRSLIYYDADDRAVMSGVSYYRADQVRYSLHVPLKDQQTNKNKVMDKLEIKKG